VIRFPLPTRLSGNPFAFQEHSESLTERGALRVPSVVVLDTAEEGLGAVRLVLTVGRDSDVEKCLALKRQAPAGRDNRGDVSKIPSVQTARRWHRRRATKHFVPGV
jgi:hypothetical protein